MSNDVTPTLYNFIKNTKTHAGMREIKKRPYLPTWTTVGLYHSIITKIAMRTGLKKKEGGVVIYQE